MELDSPVLFSVEFILAVFLYVPLVLTFTTTQNSSVVPLFMLPITHLTTPFSSIPPSLALSNSKIESSSSVIFTFVAFEGPLFVTVIVKLTSSPALQILLVKLFVFIIVKLFTGSAVTFFALALSFEVFVSLPQLVTLTEFAIVPLFNILTVKVNVAVASFASSPIVHIPVSLS